MSRRTRGSVGRRLKRLLSMNGPNAEPVDSRMSRSQENILDSSPSVEDCPLRMTQSFTVGDLNSYSLLDEPHQLAGEVLSHTTAELRKYRRGASRRACIISDLELGPEDHELKSDSLGQHNSCSSPRLQSTHLGSIRLQKSCSVSGDERLSNENRRRQLRDADNQISDVTCAAEKSKSLTRSFIKLLPSRKKTCTPESLEYFLKHKLKYSEFDCDKLLSYKCSHWRELIVSQHGVQLTRIFTDAEIKRLDSVWELFQNECNFLVEQLMVLKHVFLEPLKRCQVEGHLMVVEPFKLFGNLDELCHISYGFCQEFINKVITVTPTGEFGSTYTLVECLDSMTEKSQYGEVYHSYLLNYKSALTYLASLRNEIEDMGVFEKFCEQDERCNRLRLPDLLVAPMHHWTRLPLILARIQGYTADEKEVECLEGCIEDVKKSLKSLENKMEWLKTFERVMEIDRQLVWSPILECALGKPCLPDSIKGLLLNTQMRSGEVLADQVREVLYEGHLVLVEQERMTDLKAFLFTDILLLSKLKKDGKKSRANRSSNLEKRLDCCYNVIGQPLPVETLSVYDIANAEGSAMNVKNAFVVVQRNKFQQITAALTFQSHTSLGKENWMKLIIKASTNQMSSRAAESGPRRQESFKQLLNLDDDNSSKFMKNSRVLEIKSNNVLTHSPPRELRFSQPPATGGQIKKHSSAKEKKGSLRATGRQMSEQDVYLHNTKSTLSARTRAMSVDSFSDPRYRNRRNHLMIAETNTPDVSTADTDGSRDDDVVFEL